MKNLVQYLKLWQKKRSELKISDDPDADWLQMQGLLDTGMPESGLPDGGKSPKPPRFKLLSIMFFALSAAAMVHFAVKFSKTKDVPHHKKHYHRTHKGYGARSDSFTWNDQDSIADRPDSINDPNQAMGLPNNGASKLSLDGKSLITQNAKALPDIGHNTSTDDSKNSASSNTEAGNTDKKADHKDNGGSTKGSTPPNSNRSGSSSQRNYNSSGNVPTSSASVTDKLKQGNTQITQINGGHFQSNNELILATPQQSFDINKKLTLSLPVTTRRRVQTPVIDKPQKEQKTKANISASANKNSRTASTGGGFDWGLLIGANSSGSFTPKNQNSNFYGRLPVDLFAGAYTTFNLSNKWDFNTQVRILSPGVVSGSYKTNTTTLKITIDSTTVPSHRDTAKISHPHTTNDSRKIYSVQVPLYIVYKATDIISIKAGPVFSFPVKQISTAQVDSANRGMLTRSRFDQKMDIGLSGGVSVHYNRFIFEATYLRGLTNNKIVSDSLSYQSHINPSFQFTIGIQLGKKKK